MFSMNENYALRDLAFSLIEGLRHECQVFNSHAYISYVSICHDASTVSCSHVQVIV